MYVKIWSVTYNHIIYNWTSTAECYVIVINMMETTQVSSHIKHKGDNQEMI
jgi:hypothetical protein